MKGGPGRPSRPFIEAGSGVELAIRAPAGGPLVEVPVLAAHCFFPDERPCFVER